MREPAPTGTRRVLPHLALVLAFAIGIGAPAGSLAATAEEIRELARQATSDPDLQRELPLARPGERTERGEASAAGTHAADRRATPPNDRAAARTERRKYPGSDSGWEFRFDFTLEEVGLGLLGLLAIAVLVRVAPRLLRAYRARRPRPDPDRGPGTNDQGSESVPPEAENELEPEPAHLEPARLAEADRLARDGAYGEAVGAILRHAIERLHVAHQVNLPPSLTSREVRQRVRLDEAPGAVLDRLVAVTERSRFGGRAASESDFRACREHFLRHLAHEAGSPPR